MPTNRRITPPEEPEITVDDLDVAQFLYLLLHNENIGQVNETVTGNVVLILGRSPHHVEVVGCAHVHPQAQVHHGMITDHYDPHGC